NFPDNVARRSYKAIEFTFEKRFAGNWQALVNYTLSRAYGNQFADFSSQLFDYPGSTCNVPNENGQGTFAQDCAIALTQNQGGIALYDRTSVANAFVSYTWNLPIVNIVAAPSATLFSGLPYQEQRTFNLPSNIGGTGVYYYQPRGSERLLTSYQ